MPFSVEATKTKKTYYLHSKDVMLAGNRKQTIYYFKSSIEKNALDEVPEGYEVFLLERSGFPMLRKIKNEISTAK